MYKKQIFTVDKQTFGGLSGFVNDLHNRHMKYVVIVVSVNLLIYITAKMQTMVKIRNTAATFILN